MFTLGDDEIEIDVSPRQRGARARTSESERSVAYATFILESVCDRYEFASDENGAHLRLFKRAGSTDAD